MAVPKLILYTTGSDDSGVSFNFKDAGNVIASNATVTVSADDVKG